MFLINPDSTDRITNLIFVSLQAVKVVWRTREVEEEWGEGGEEEGEAEEEEVEEEERWEETTTMETAMEKRWRWGFRIHCPLTGQSTWNKLLFSCSIFCIFTVFRTCFRWKKISEPKSLWAVISSFFCVYSGLEKHGISVMTQYLWILKSVTLTESVITVWRRWLRQHGGRWLRWLLKRTQPVQEVQR